MTDQPFTTLSLDPSWIENLDHLGYTSMTAIQARALPIMLTGQDVIAQAHTGTGKTAAFALALLSRITPNGRLPGALILSPTRELATQIAEEIRRLARPLANTNVITLCGGHSFGRQREALNNGVDVVVGTPGRVLDHLNEETLRLSKLSTLVLDEADRMLDMGFIDDVAAIADTACSRRQTLLFSATISPEVRDLSKTIQTDATFISVADQSTLAPDIDQILYDIGNLDRIEALQRVLAYHQPDSAVIFCNQRNTCDDVTRQLKSLGYSARALHGGMEQRTRDTTLLLFGNGSLRILVATNVAARGLDINDLNTVINFELPRETEAFTHRVGRTGRAGHEGVAISLISDLDERRLQKLDDHLSHIDPIHATDLPPTHYTPPPAAMKTIAIQGGRKDKLRPGDIVGAFTGELGIPNHTIGLITSRDRITFVALDRDVAQRALDAIDQGQIKGRNFGSYMMH